MQTDPLNRLDIRPGEGRPLRELVEVWKKGEPMSAVEQARFQMAKKDLDFDALAFTPPASDAAPDAPPAAPAPGLAFDAAKLSESEWLAFKARGYQP